MLVLTQRVKDGPIHIIDSSGEEIGAIHLLGITGGQCKYGFDFNDDIEIQRDVIYQKIIKENDNA